jgi:hypothetical protein
MKQKATHTDVCNLIDPSIPRSMCALVTVQVPTPFNGMKLSFWKKKETKKQSKGKRKCSYLVKVGTNSGSKSEMFYQGSPHSVT